ncbi:MAG TPA: twin-arginine translocase TatA/TatE family subunit [Micropepsaceae bacterium]|jgi:sec-independent protein translocase protein TatA
MGSFSIWHWLILIAVVALLFGGKGKISGLMGDFAHGIRNFKEGLKDPNDPSPPADKVEAKKADEVKQG